MQSKINATQADIIPAKAEVAYPFSAVCDFRISKSEINQPFSARLQFRNYRELEDSLEYSPNSRSRNIPNLEAWIEGQVNAAELSAAFQLLLSSMVTYHERKREIELNPPSSSSSSSSIIEVAEEGL